MPRIREHLSQTHRRNIVRSAHGIIAFRTEEEILFCQALAGQLDSRTAKKKNKQRETKALPLHNPTAFTPDKHLRIPAHG